VEQVHRGEFEAVVPRARLWAVVSLLAGLGLLAAVVAFLARNGVYVVVGVAGVALSVTGSWWAITGRSFRRAAGSVGLAVGVAVLAVALVLLAVAAGAARAALAAQLRATAPAEHRLAPPAHPVLLCNPWSGGGKVKTFGLEELASSMGVETVMLDRGLDLEQLARDAVDRSADCLGMAGGDGSQALVASIAVEKGLPFVCVTAGTRNHFALDLGLDRDDPRRSVHAFGDAIERRIDYATVNDRFFVNNVSLGIYATIVQQEGYREAKAETTRRLVPEMLGDRTDPFDLQFTTPDGREVDGAFLIQVSNNPYVLGPSLDVSQRRRLDSGRLGVFAISANTGAQAAEVLTLALAGQELRSGSAFQFECETFEVRSRSGTAYAGVDGEALELATPLRFQIHRLGLRLLVPAGNLEAARRRQAREIRVRDLVQLARGRTEEVAAR